MEKLQWSNSRISYDYMINYVRVQRKVNVGGEGDERSGRHF